MALYINVKKRGRGKYFIETPRPADGTYVNPFRVHRENGEIVLFSRKDIAVEAANKLRKPIANYYGVDIGTIIVRI